MKRSRHLRLGLMALAAPAILTGCDTGPETGQVLMSAQDCATVPIRIPVEQCVTAYNEALAQHERVAPRFENGWDCQDQFGACSQIDDSAGTFFIPAMGGFLLGYSPVRDDDDDGRSGGYLYRYGGTSPLYVDRSGGYYNPAGGHVRDGFGSVKGKAGIPATPTRAVTVSRSGFGSTSSARSSFGGGRGFGS